MDEIPLVATSEEGTGQSPHLIAFGAEIPKFKIHNPINYVSVGDKLFGNWSLIIGVSDRSECNEVRAVVGL